ncbi:MAG: hypothetical protein OXN89_06860 [Bryobacterales bacterium]|nr:hypothetical protein [Bryobacterales bacterium]
MSIDRRDFLGMLALLGAAAQAAAQTGDPASESYEEVRTKLEGAKLLLVPYSHNDFSWFASEAWHWERAALIDERAVEIMRREREFKWFIDVKLERIDRTAELKPEILAELQELSKTGRVGIAAGTVANNDNPFNEPEAVIRNMTLGRKFFEREFPDAKLDVACFIDIHPGHTQMPQILRKAGYSYYRFTRPIWALDRKGYKREFVWEGLDGSEVTLTYGPYGWLAGGWGMGKGPGGYLRELNAYREDWEGAVRALYDSALRFLMPASETKVIWLPVGLDHTLPLSLPAYSVDADGEPTLDLPGFARAWQERETTPLRFATPTEYFAELEKARDEIPRFSGPVDPVGWPFWYGQCGSRGLDNWRDRVNHELVEAEVYSAMAACVGVPYPEARLEDLWHEALTLYPHDGLYVGDEDMPVAIETGRNVTFQAGRLRSAAMRHLVHRIEADRETQTIAVFNPLAFDRDGTVAVKAVFAEPRVTKLQVLDADGSPLPHQLLRVRHFNNSSEHLPPGAKNTYKEAWLLVKASVPALGYATLRVVRADGDEEPAYPDEPVSVLENSFVKIELGPEGIREIRDKVRGATYAGAGNPVFHTNDDPWPWHGGPVTGTQHIEGAAWTLVEDGSLRTSARMEGRIGSHGAELLVSLDHVSGRIDFKLDIDSAGGSGYFAARVVFDHDSIPTAGIPFGAEPRDLSGEPWGDGTDPNEELLRRDVFFAHHWVDYSGDGRGLALFGAEGKRGWLFHPEERTLEHILMMTIEPRGEMENLFANPYFTGRGHHEFTYSLVFHDGDWRTARIAQVAEELIHPCRTRHIYARPGASLPSGKSFVSASPASVAASSWLYREGGFEIRLHDTVGRSGPVRVALPAGAGSCTPVDFNGRPLASPAVAVSDGAASFEIGAWEIVTLRFEMQS